MKVWEIWSLQYTRLKEIYSKSFLIFIERWEYLIIQCSKIFFKPQYFHNFFLMLVYKISALLTLLYIFLSFYVIFLRRKNGISLGSKWHEALEIAIRVHSNYIEYTLLFIVLLYFAESSSLSYNHILWLGWIFILARLFHAFWLIYKHIPTRTIDMLGTFGCLINLALYLLNS